MLVLLLGITGGVVLTAAGAVRTDTSYPRLLRWAARPWPSSPACRCYCWPR